MFSPEAGEKLGEPIDIRMVRCLLHHWPLRRGKGLAMRLLRPLIVRRRFLMEAESGLFVYPELEDKVLYWCFTDGADSWEPSMKLSLGLIRPDEIVLDVGAHVGLWTLGAARRAGPGGRVHAFEPVVDNRRRLERNLRLNGLGSVHCSEYAISDRTGTALFCESMDDNKGTGSLAGSDEAAGGIIVPTKTLDAYCREQGLDRIHSMKVDVEGAEAAVFRGGQEMLRTGPVIMFEANDSLASRFASSTTDVKQMLTCLGYSIYRVGKTSLSRVEVRERHRGEDLLALLPKHADRVVLPGMQIDSV